MWLHSTYVFTLQGPESRDLPPDSLFALKPKSTNWLKLASSVTPSCAWWHRNINLLYIGYACQPHLSPRLTQGGRALPLATLGFRRMGFSPILSLLTPAFSLLNTPAVLSVNLRRVKYAPLPIKLLSNSAASVLCLAPIHFRRRITRLVSYYALFKGWLLLSQPPSCLCDPTSFPT